MIMIRWNSFTLSILACVLQFALTVTAIGLEEKVEFTIEEGVSRGIVVGRIQKREGYSYRLNERNRFFTFNASTGEILTLEDAGAPLLDREALERHGYKHNEVDFVILGAASHPAITPAAYFIAVTVRLTDLNDNSPTFPFPFQNVSLPESARVGTRLVLASASDLDEGENGRIKEYRLISGNEGGVFRLTRGGNGAQESPEAVLLELLTPIDRETRNLYILNVSAADGGTPPLMGFLPVFVNILDSNDNQPRFDRQQYSVSVSETLPAGSSILLVSATDRDSGENARITYSIGNDIENQFRINPDTGVLFSNKAPLRCPEMKPANSSGRVCTFTVEASDHGVPAQTGRAFVNVELFGVNSHSPLITFRYYSPADSGNGADMAAVIEETKPAGAVVAVVTVTDPDHGDNGKTSVSIVKGNELGHFRLESNELFSVVRTNAALKRNDVDQYNLTIMAADRGVPAKFAFKNMLIYVNDASSDVQPVFDQATYAVKIPENSPLGSYVLSVTARLGEKNKAMESCKIGVWYDFVNDTTADRQMFFRLDHRTGLITVAGSLDFDEGSNSGRNFTLIVSAKDACRPSLRSSVATVKIQLTDVNDSPPGFSKSMYDVSVYENATIGSPVLQLEAHDGDSGDNGRIGYAFASSTNPSYLRQFAVHAVTGRITLISQLDRETTSSYILPVLAYDHGSPRLEASATVRIRVLDLNDHQPLFLTTEYYANLHRFAPARTRLARIHAYDPDEGANGEITYFFLQPPPINAIALSQKTGDVYLKTRMTPNGPNRFDVVLGAADGGGQRATNNATIHVYISDIGEGNSSGLPKFTKETYVFRVQEDVGLNSANGGALKSIGTVSATDADATLSNSPIQYKIVDGDYSKLFEIGQYSGELRAAGNLDYEQSGEYNLTVAAIEKTGVAVVNVKIEIQDSNDIAPVFLVNETTLVVERGYPAGYKLDASKAIDMDSGVNGLVKYSLKNDSEAGKHFSVDQTSGTIFLTTPAYVLKKNEYVFTILATDSGSPALTSTSLIRVSVVDGDPRLYSWFPRAWYDFEVWGNTAVNTKLIRLNLTKPCSQNGANDCLFHVENDLASDAFGVFPDGWIYVKNELDLETRASFQLNIGVKQALSSRKGGLIKETTSVALVNFNLLHSNTNSPRCSSDKFSFSLPEHYDRMSYVGTVIAEDADSGLNGFVHYRILPDSNNSSSHFHIGPSSGDLTALRSFDREKLVQTRGSAVLKFVVEAEDFGSPERKRARCNVEIEITDINDQQPVFALDVYAVSLPENQDIGTEILRVSATDADELENGIVEFLIAEGDDPEPKFWINSTTGQLFLQGTLDREYKDSYTLQLMAKDFGKPERLNSSAYVMVFVLDVNDHVPWVNSQNVITLSELAPIGSLVTVVNATDPDSGAAGSVRYSLTEGNVGQTFELNAITGALVLIKPLDYETQRNFTLTVWASDQGTPNLTNVSQILINLIDENDNSPVITAPILVSQIPGDSAIGTKVFTVTATDQDTELNGTVRFGLVDQKPSRAFAIDEESGVITVATKLDSEWTDVYNLVVEATDSCENQSLRLFTRRMITILLNDPEERSVSVFSAPRAIAVNADDSRVQQRIYQTGNPKNAGIYSYHLVEGDKGLFDLASNGELVLKRTLDGSRPLYKLKVAAASLKNSTSSDKLYTDYTVIACFTKGSFQFEKTQYEFPLLKTSPNGTELGKVKILQNGSSRNTEYYVTRLTLFPSTNSTNDTQGEMVIDVDTHSGVVFSTGLLHRKRFQKRSLNTILLEITAVDVGSASPSCSRCEVIIKIGQESKPIKFSEYFYQFQISEDVPVGTTVGLVKSADTQNNTPNQSSLQFSIVNGTSVPFNMDARTGIITTSKLLDRESMAGYDFEVIVTDGLTSAYASVHLDVLDTNDNEPYVDQIFHFKVVEGAQRSSFVGRVIAIDKDSGANGEIEYSMLKPELTSYFSIDAITGVIRVEGFIDREQHAFFFLDIQAADRGNPPKRANTTVFVEVSDTNNFSPVLEQSFYEVSVLENATIGTSLLQLMPWDYDIDTKFSFSIVSGNVWSQFAVDDNGTLTILSPLDRESRSVYHLVISVHDQPPDVAVRYSTNAQVTITVLDTNDCYPQFTSPNWASINLDATVGTIVATIRAIDLDEGQAGSVNYMLDPGSAGVFSLDPVSGDLRLTGSISKERCQSMYNLSIWAYDRGQPILSNNWHFNVYVVSEGDAIRPSFEQKLMEISVSEDAPIGTTLLQLKLQQNELQCEMAVRYWTLENQGDELDFLVSPDTGILSIARPLDFERRNNYNLTVAVAGLKMDQPSDWATVLVKVKDVNDFTPKFLQSPVYFDVLEGTWTAGAVSVGLVSAVDADSGPNGKLFYAIIQGNTSIFSIDSLNGELKMQGEVDREVIDSYILTVEVADSGSPRRTATTSVIINVLDLNDNTQVFDKPSYVGAVLENQPVGQFVLNVSASDRDEGENGLVSYRLESPEQVPFVIDETTGEIRTKSMLDRELVSVYTFNVIAADSAPGDPKSTTARVTVTVEDENDNSPVLVDSAQDIYVSNVAADGEILYVIGAEDADEGKNARLVYSLAGRDVKYFDIAADTGVIRWKTASSRKLDNDFSVDVFITDSGEKQRRNTSTSLRFFPRSADDFPVFIGPKIRNFSVPENETNFEITVISARSRKQAPQNRVTYSIAGGNFGNAFVLDAVSGRLSTTTAMDFELHQTYELYVMASDNDNPPLMSFAKIIVNVIDYNDNEPSIRETSYTATILEEEPAPLRVVQVQATDADSGLNGRIRYAIREDSQSGIKQLFDIDPETGVITTKNALDREKASQYQFMVDAVDGGSPSLTASVPVIVNVADMNDCAPRFTRLFAASVPEDAAVGAFVTRVTSSDADSTPENANNTYYFSLNPGDNFAIDPRTGDVTVKGTLDRETEAEYQLKVVAADGSWRVETSLTVTLRDVNDNEPTCSSSNYTFTVSDQQPPFTLIGRVQANDSDETGPNSKVTYRLLDKSSFFLVDSQTGALRTARTLRQAVDEPGFHHLAVVAEDTGRPVLSSTCHVTVKVVSGHNRLKVFQKKALTLAMPSDVSNGARIAQIATELQNSERNRIVLALDDPSDDMTIDPLTGTIISTKQQSTAIGTERKLTIVAQDATTLASVDTVDVTLIATDANTNSPEFSSSTYSVSVAENAPLGSAVFTVSARDHDQGLNGKVTYTCVRNKTSDGACDLFAVDEDTGVIVLRKSLDYEAVQQHTFVVAATDSGYQPKSAFATITVSVQDANDERPYFISEGKVTTTLQAHVWENAPLGSPVIRLLCSDADAPPHNSILYTIEDGAEGKFVMNETNGLVRVTGDIDFEKKAVYKLTVKCANPDSSAMSTTAILTIRVEGQNEYPPKFEKTAYHFEASWTVADGTVVGRVKAVDDDAGQDGVVYYSMKGGEDNGALMIEELTGEVIVRKRNGENATFATVLAHNSPLTSSAEIAAAYVTVSFSPGKASVPMFRSKTMYAELLENATIGTSILSVNTTATSRPFYVLDDGNIGGAFQLDTDTGVLLVNGRLDREAVDKYSLTIKAYAEKNGSAFAPGTVIVTVLDTNDERPYLTEPASVGYILENEPSGTAIMTLLPSDDDLPPNREPFTFTLLESKSSHLFHLDSTTGVLRSKAVFDRESVSRYALPVKITDGGQPALSSVQNVTVVIKDVNDEVSTNEGTLVQVLCLDGVVPEKVDMAAAYPADPDSSGLYTCESRMENQTENGRLVKADCLVSSDGHVTVPSSHTLLLASNDGLHDWVSYQAVVKFEQLHDAMVKNAVLVTVRGDRGKLAVSFTSWMNNILSKNPDKRFLVAKIVYVAPQRTLFTDEYEIALVIQDEKNEPLLFAQAAILLESVRIAGPEFQVRKVFKGFCEGTNSSSPCRNGGTCVELATMDTSVYDFITERNFSLSFPRFSRSYRCDCPTDLSGVHCETVMDHCASRPCANGATCIYKKELSKIECICPSGFTGPTCSDDIDECKSGNDQPACFNNGWCENTKGSYRCVCMVGFSGRRCENSTKYCTTNPCLNGGKCTANSNDYSCACEFGYAGKDCQIGSKGFDVASYIEFENTGLKNRNENKIEFEFATIRPNSLVLYSYVPNGDVDYVALDISAGHLRLSGLQNGAKVDGMVEKTAVNDGQWRKVELKQTGEKLTMSVGECSWTECVECPHNDESCQLVVDMGSQRHSWFPGDSIFLGTVRDFTYILSQASQLSGPGFVGCIRNVKVNGVGIDELNILSQDGILESCPRSSQSPCSSNQSNPCGEGERCQDGWAKPVCSCRGGFSSSNCKTAEEGANFNGGGYISYHLTESYRRRLLFALAAPASKISNPEDLYRFKRLATSHYPKQWVILEFRSTVPDGVLFFAMSSSEEFSLIDIVNGTVRYVSRSRKSIPMQITLNDGPYVSDGEWHLVSLALQPSGNEVEFRIDNFGKDARSSEPLHSIASADLKGMSLGGVAEPVKIGGNTLKGFTGCMRKFIINGVLQPLLHGDITFFNITPTGDVTGACDAGSSCASPPCPNPPTPARFNASVVAVLVFFTCMIVSTGVAYFIVRRVKNRKGGKAGNGERMFVNAASTIANIATLSDIVRSKQTDGPNLNGSMKDSGIVLGISRQTLDSSQISLNNPLDVHGTASSSALSSSTYINNYLNGDQIADNRSLRKERDSEKGNSSQGKKTFGPGMFVERYDLEDASSIAPSDVDVTKHYRDYRQHNFGLFAGDGPPRKLPSKFVPPPPPPFMDSVPSLFSSSYASAQSLASRNRSRTALTSVLAMMPESESSDDVMMQRNVRIGQGDMDASEMISKRRTESTRSLRPRHRRHGQNGERASGKLRRSAKRKSKRRQQVHESRENDVSSESCASSSDSGPTIRCSSRRSTPQASSVAPRILSCLDKERDIYSPKSSTKEDYSDCTKAQSDFDLDQVRKPRRFLQPPEDTETDSDFNAVTNHGNISFCLDQFIPGPRTLFLMSEDDENASDTATESRDQENDVPRASALSQAAKSGLPSLAVEANQKDGLEAFV